MRNPAISSRVGEGAGCFLIGFALFWSAFVIGIDVVLVRTVWFQWKAVRFATTTARITQSEVVTSRGSKGSTSYNVRIAYQYSVAGNTYTGTRYRYGNLGGSDRRWAATTVSANPAGSQRTVYYDPERPSDAVLHPGIEGADLFMATFLTPFNLVMVALWWGGVALVKKSKTPLPAGGVKLFQEPGRTRARLSELNAVATALIVLGVGAFASIFIVGIASGFNPSLTVMAVTWSVLLASSFGFALWHHTRLLAGHFDLTIDLGSRTLSLPATDGRKNRRLIGWKQISSVEVRPVHGRKRSVNYKVILHNQSDGPAEEILLTTHDESKAENFASWLRERLGLAM